MIVDKYGIYIAHLENLAEDKSYPNKERQKFKGWLQKWSYARIPMLSAMFLEILAPAKLLSKDFQNEQIDIVMTVGLLQRSKKQFDRIINKEFNQLPSVKRFLDSGDKRRWEKIISRGQHQSF